MANLSFDIENNPYAHYYNPDDGAGGFSPGYTIEYNPATGKFEPKAAPGAGTPGSSGGPGSSLSPSGGPKPVTTPTTPPVAPVAGVPWYQNPAWIDTLLGAAGAVYGAYKSGQTPNTYDIPLSPNEQVATDAKTKLFNYQSGYNDQFLRGLGNLNPDFKLNNSEVGNPAFMGGVKVPVVDWSKMPERPTAGTAVNNVNPAAVPTDTNAVWAEIAGYGGEALAAAKRLTENDGLPLPIALQVIRRVYGAKGGTTP